MISNWTLALYVFHLVKPEHQDRTRGPMTVSEYAELLPKPLIASWHNASNRG